MNFWNSNYNHWIFFSLVDFLSMFLEKSEMKLSGGMTDKCNIFNSLCAVICVTSKHKYQGFVVLNS